MGTVNPLGNNVKDFWKAIKAGENGIDKLTRFEIQRVFSPRWRERRRNRLE